MSNKEPLFSIITVCYNAEQTITQTIKSLLDQSFNDFEYIIIDGNSTDNTLQIIHKFQPLFKGRMNYTSEDDDGIYDAMNKGIKLAKGKYVALLNSDDWFESNTLKVLSEQIKSKPADIYYGLQNFYKNGVFYKVECIHHNYLDEAPLYHATCFISKKTYNKIGLYELQYKLASDYEFFYRCRKFNLKFQYIPIILANFSLDGSTTNHKALSMIETYKIRYNYNIIDKKQLLKTIFKIKILKSYSILLNKIRKN